MKHIHSTIFSYTCLLALVLVSTFSFTSCDDDETYADRRKRERKQVESFLKNGTEVKDPDSGEVFLSVPGNIKVLSESEFYANDSTTDVSKNEYVLFSGSGIYMQIVRRGIGDKLQDGERATLLTRFTEFNIAADSITCTNTTLDFATLPDVMTVVNTSGTFTASFTSGVLQARYGSKAVPNGWLIPLTFIGIGRQSAPDEEIAKVRLIIPSTEGQSDAMNNVYACFYEITYQRSR
ncbi:MAG: DUF4827 domain-containing protein [Bacteroidales bacterium]|nr:DUF4827 domain-containing protein [Bacteroidales bacterium]